MSTRRRLIVMRHAKSSWSSGAATDHDRPLNKRGRRDSPKVGARLAELDWVPDLVLSSDSARTRETWERLAPSLSAEVPARFTGALYHDMTEGFRREVSAVGDEVRTVLVLGHNPGCEVVVRWLCGEDLELKTANAVLLEGEADHWHQLVMRGGRLRLVELIRSREL